MQNSRKSMKIKQIVANDKHSYLSKIKIIIFSKFQKVWNNPSVLCTSHCGRYSFETLAVSELKERRNFALKLVTLPTSDQLPLLAAWCCNVFVGCRSQFVLTIGLVRYRTADARAPVSPAEPLINRTAALLSLLPGPVVSGQWSLTGHCICVYRVARIRRRID